MGGLYPEGGDSTGLDPLARVKTGPEPAVRNMEAQSSEALSSVAPAEVVRGTGVQEGADRSLEARVAAGREAMIPGGLVDSGRAAAEARAAADPPMVAPGRAPVVRGPVVRDSVVRSSVVRSSVVRDSVVRDPVVRSSAVQGPVVQGPVGPGPVGPGVLSPVAPRNNESTSPADNPPRRRGGAAPDREQHRRAGGILSATPEGYSPCGPVPRT